MDEAPQNQNQNNSQTFVIRAQKATNLVRSDGWDALIVHYPRTEQPARFRIEFEEPPFVVFEFAPSDISSCGGSDDKWARAIYDKAMPHIKARLSAA